MNKFNFEYFIKRATMLNEARPTKRFQGIGDNMEFKLDYGALRNKVKGIIKTGKHPDVSEMVDSNGMVADAAPRNIQYRTLLYMFSKVYSAVLDKEILLGDIDYTEDLELINAKKLLSMEDISGLNTDDVVKIIISALWNNLKKNKIDIESITREELEDISHKTANQLFVLMMRNQIDRQNKPYVQVFDEDPAKYLSEIYESRSSRGSFSDDTSNSTETNKDKQYDSAISKIASKIVRENDPNWESATTSIERLERATVILIKQNPDAIFTQSFVNDVLNPESIANFINGHYGRTISSSSTSVKATERLVSRYDLPEMDMDKLLSDVKPYIKNINNLYKYKLRRKNKEDIITKNPNVIVDDSTITLDIIKDVLEGYIDIKNIFSRTFNKIYNSNEEEEVTQNSQYALEIARNINEMSFRSVFTDEELISLIYIAMENSDILEELLEYFDDFEEGTGIMAVDFKNELQPYMNSVDKSLIPLLKLIIKEVGDDAPTITSNEYPEFDIAILNKVLTTPESKRLFHEWYTKIYKKDKEYNEKLRRDILSGEVGARGETAQLNRVLSSRSNMKSPSEIDQDREKRLNRLQKKENEMESGDYIDPDIDEDPFKESYVMSYMTEQINKDKFKPTGEFKDRGFKKPKNYFEGLISKNINI